MPSWNPQQYLKFERERSRPCRDLVNALEMGPPCRIVDLGCGPGNSTELLAKRFPEAHITGVDCSDSMLAVARKRLPNVEWVAADLTTWRADCLSELCFSNAALQWVELETLLPRLISQVAPSGVLAFQVPHNLDAPAQKAMTELSASPAFRTQLEGKVQRWFMHPPDFYYDRLALAATRVDLWTTEYVHVLPSVEAIVEWYKGSGLRPILDALSSESARERFLTAYLEALRGAYPTQPSGHVLLPFRRLFVVAYR